MPKLTIETNNGFKAEIVDIHPPRLNRTFLVEGGTFEAEFDVIPNLPKVGTNDIIEISYPETKIYYSFRKRTVPPRPHKKTYIKRYERKAKEYYWSRKVHVTIETTVNSIHSRETEDGVEIEINHSVIGNG